jgi:hypothetical protein
MRIASFHAANRCANEVLPDPLKFTIVGWGAANGYGLWRRFQLSNLRPLFNVLARLSLKDSPVAWVAIESYSYPVRHKCLVIL